MDIIEFYRLWNERREVEFKGGGSPIYDFFSQLDQSVMTKVERENYLQKAIEKLKEWKDTH